MWPISTDLQTHARRFVAGALFVLAAALLLAAGARAEEAPGSTGNAGEGVEPPAGWVSFVHPRAGFALHRPPDLIEAPGQPWDEDDSFRIVTWRFDDGEGEISVHGHPGPGRLSLVDWVNEKGGVVRVESPADPFIMARSALDDGVLTVSAYVQVPNQERILEFQLEIPNIEDWRGREMQEVAAEYTDRLETFWHIIETLRVPTEPGALQPQETVKQPAE